MKTNYRMTRDVAVVADYLGDAVLIGFDFETAPQAGWRDDPRAALDPHRGEIVGVSLAVSAGSGVYLPLKHRDFDNADADAVFDYLKRRVFENPGVVKIAHNLAFEAKFLLARGIALVAPVYDTMAAAQLIYKEEGHFRRLADVGLKTLAKDWFGLALPRFVEVVGLGSFADLDPRAQPTIDYACSDADLARRLYFLLNDWFQANIPAHENLVKGIESPVALFTARMELSGFQADAAAIAAAAAVCQERLGIYQNDLERGGHRPVRVGKNAATNDLKAYLFSDLGLPVKKRTDTGKAALDEDAIKQLISHCREQGLPAIAYLEAISAYRGLNKLYKTYVLGLGEQINPATGAIHTQLFPLGTATGRFSSAAPNCQNLPAGPVHGIPVRDFFMARPGTTLVAVDYSQIELRIGAWFTGDANLLRVYREGGDIHAVTTAAIYGITLAEAGDKSHPDYKARRTVAKNINFGIFYGLYPRGLQDILRVKAGQQLSLSACEAMIFNLRRAYPGLVPWQEATRQAACYCETVDTALGRRRTLTGINAPEPGLQSHYERAALNHPIQGTAADILKLAMVRLEAGLGERPYIKPLLTVHDEIVFEVETPRLAEAIAWITEVMTAMPFPGFDVPLAVEVTVGQRYGSLVGWEPGERGEPEN
ncbi:DNA polymerase [Acetobacterium wieringae]|uniref:DNA polymerase I n=1 Tax=Acetobacterium wieringae TaxID=52694 RepID=A0A1F2PMV2_9FIRM|nr:DNA polymerase [Acetobacterium wieringae]OFV72052.1 DNA polymerase I [Acetobacterium wieringae]